ncbi:MAG: hypothetical protein HYY36_00320 [Gammaproteobacteria bacterium]|nr:hypothetical protein [Gammaproteobacteria bacterium]
MSPLSMQRWIFVTAFLFVGVLWQLAPAYACPLREGMTLLHCCCAPFAMTEDDNDATRCAMEPNRNSGPCCKASNIPQFIFHSVILQARNDSQPDRSLYLVDDQPPCNFRPSGTRLARYQEATNTSWLFGTDTYLITARLRN